MCLMRLLQIAWMIGISLYVVCIDITFLFLINALGEYLTLLSLEGYRSNFMVQTPQAQLMSLLIRMSIIAPAPIGQLSSRILQETTCHGLLS